MVSEILKQLNIFLQNIVFLSGFSFSNVGESLTQKSHISEVDYKFTFGDYDFPFAGHQLPTEYWLCKLGIFTEEIYGEKFASGF